MAWTPEQQKAIDTRDRTLLVSAAAGSGKTATLTERIIKSILDEENPIDIERMLIATYTNAAVDELRDRIGKAIKKAALENPENTRLEEQLLKLKDAKILTITAFCNSILRSCAESIGLTPNYRIAEPAEAKILSSSVLEALINAAYEGDISDVCTAEEFIEVADCISNVKHAEGLSNVIAQIFEKLTYTERGIDTLGDLIEEYNPERFVTVEKTFIGSYIIKELKEAFGAYKSAYENLLRTATEERLDVKNLPVAESDFALIQKILSETEYDAIFRTLCSTKPDGLSKGKEEATEFYLGLKFLHTHFNEDFKKFSNELFFYSTAEWQDLYTKLYKLLKILYKFLKKYNDVFLEEKRSRGVCEFSDVERYAYEALYNPDGSVTDLARELSDKFDAIYVDEYQDVNALQGKVFAAISKPYNRFMVGDIKQSIYGFRSSRPEIFLDMKNSFPLIGSEGDYPAASIFMSNNFRCDSMVVDFVNGVFDTLFGLFGDKIGYVPDDKLKFSKIYEKGTTPRGIVPEIHILEKPRSTKTGDSEDPADEIINEEKNKNRLEAAHIANKISTLLESSTLASGKRVEPRDVAVLMHSVKTELAEELTNALNKHGIPSSITETGDLFVCEEVLLALSFLYSVDNPRKDIYLCALMLSPLFEFTPDELLKIRKFSDKESLWEALADFTRANPSYMRGVRFIAEILKYRKASETERADTLLSMIYRESGLMALASKNGSRDNLVLLHSYARKYESTGFKGLYSFISYINEVIERGEKFPAAESVSEENAVRIMTIHKSKGLEFPVTFLAGASAARRSRESKICFHESFGIALRTKDDTGLAVIDNPVFHAISRYAKSVEFDEELRVLYVALTRAREQLYVYGASPKADAEDYLDSINRFRDVLNPYFASKAKSYLDMIMLSKTCGMHFIDSPLSEGEADTDTVEKSVTETAIDSPSTVSREEYVARFSFEYEKAHLEKLPKKISVSRLSPAILDVDESSVGLDEISLVESFLRTDVSEDDTPSISDATPEAPIPFLPDFISGKSENESRERGIATHKILQFCDFDKLAENPEAELARLAEGEFISKEDVKLVRINELRAFVKSSLFEEIKLARALHRELRFNVFLNASGFTRDEDKKTLLSGEKILVQGVIDCLIEREDGSLHLIDYKTDRLTREELASPELAEQRLRNAHTLQLSYYKEAIAQLFGKSPSKVGVYSLHLGKEVVLKL